MVLFRLQKVDWSTQSTLNEVANTLQTYITIPGMPQKHSLAKLLLFLVKLNTTKMKNCTTTTTAFNNDMCTVYLLQMIVDQRLAKPYCLDHYIHQQNCKQQMAYASLIAI